MDNKAKAIISVLVLALVFMAGYAAHRPRATEEASVAVDAEAVFSETVKIGLPLPLSGKAASYGEILGNGFELGREEVNAKYPFSLEFVYEDTQGDASVAVSATRKLVDADGVRILLGPIRSNSLLAAAPITEEKKALVFSPISSAEEISQAGDYVFRNREGSSSHSLGATEFLLERGISRVAVLSALSANSLTYARFFQTDFRDAGGEITAYEEYDENSSDFRTLLSRVSQDNPDAFYLSVALGPDAGLLVKQLRELNYEGMIIGSLAIKSQEFLDAAGEAAQGVLFSAPTFDPEDPAIADYAQAFEAAYGHPSDAFAANSYDAVKLIAAGIEHCQSADTDCLRDYLYGVKDYPGAGGLTTFDENGDVVKPIQIMEVKDGEFVKFED